MSQQVDSYVNMRVRDYFLSYWLFSNKEIATVNSKIK